MVFQHFRKSVLFLAENEEGIVPNSMSEGYFPRHHRRVGRACDRNRGECSLEKDALFCEAVDYRSLRSRVTVATEMVGPGRVDRDDDDVDGIDFLPASGEWQCQRRKEEKDGKIPEGHGRGKVLE